MAKTTKTRSSRSLWPVVVFVVFGLAFAAAVGAAVYYRKEFQRLNSMSAEQFSERDNQKVIDRVGELYTLPADETPSIATIKDKDTVKQQYPFLSEAENGDTLLLYKDNKLAILYRSSTKQLVKVGALNVQDAPRVVVVGTQSDRASVEDALRSSSIDFDTAKPQTTLSGVTVVATRDEFAGQAQTLAEQLDGVVGQAPEGEDSPESADITVYVGAAADEDQQP
ncbi:hypothetical protein CR970_00925 [Candidatus Saccharibacteria bacterium]|nr:MAG: hypothetical protein CR970_00925 [Candidatus Saccharibacteria bacterium]